MMKRATILRGLVMFGVLAVVGFSGAAWADPIGPTCNGAGQNNSCFGNIFTLTFENLVNVSGPNSELDVTLEIDTTSHTLPATDVIRDVAVKIAPNGVVSASLTDAPGGVGSWTTLIGGLANNGCSLGDNGFICSSDADIADLDGSTYSWTWHVAIPDGTLLTGANAASVKARYCEPATTCDGNDFEGLTSENITLQTEGGGTGLPEVGVPEPASVALLGTGLLGLALLTGVRALRRRS